VRQSIAFVNSNLTYSFTMCSFLRIRGYFL